MLNALELQYLRHCQCEDDARHFLSRMLNSIKDIEHYMMEWSWWRD